MTDYTRLDWGARPPKVAQPRLSLVQYVPLHHIGAGGAWPTNVPEVLRSIQAMEQNGGYVDIAYCRGIDGDGNEWELRGDVKDGATLGYSGRSFSILYIANAAAAGFSVPQRVIDGVIRCIRRAQARGIVASNPSVFIEGHTWFDAHVTSHPTACPYPLLEATVPAIQVAVQFENPVSSPPTAHTTTHGELMQFFDFVHDSAPNRTRSITVTPDGLIFRSNGGRLGPHSYTDPTIKPFGDVKFYDIPSTLGAGESFVGANYNEARTGIIYQSRISGGTLADRELLFTEDGA